MITNVRHPNKTAKVHLFQKDILRLSSENDSQSFAVIKYLCCYTKMKHNSAELLQTLSKRLRFILGKTRKQSAQRLGDWK